MGRRHMTTLERLEAFKRGELKPTAHTARDCPNAWREKGKRGRSMQAVRAQQAEIKARLQAEERARAEEAARQAAVEAAAEALTQAVTFAKLRVLGGEDPRRAAVQAGKTYGVPPRDVFNALT